MCWGKRERERERVGVGVCARVFECVCVCEREREREEAATWQNFLCKRLSEYFAAIWVRLPPYDNRKRLTDNYVRSCDQHVALSLSLSLCHSLSHTRTHSLSLFSLRLFISLIPLSSLSIFHSHLFIPLSFLFLFYLFL